MSNTICPRPTLEQVIAMLNFMEKHPKLALGKMKGGVEARSESKKLWFQLSRTLNAMTGPTRPTKSWIKFWSDKKSNVKAKVQSAGGDASSLLSNIERRIWDLFLSDEPKINHSSKQDRVKEEPSYTDTTLFNDEADHHHNNDIEFEEQPIVDFEERQINLMEKLVQAMSNQASALSQLAHASSVQAQAMEKLAEASQIQARAVERAAIAFEGIGVSTHDMRNAIVDIDLTLKRFYTSPT